MTLIIAGLRGRWKAAWLLPSYQTLQNIILKCIDCFVKYNPKNIWEEYSWDVWLGRLKVPVVATIIAGLWGFCKYCFWLCTVVQLCKHFQILYGDGDVGRVGVVDSVGTIMAGLWEGGDRSLPGFLPNIGLCARRFNKNAKYSLPNFQTHWTLVSWSSDDDA